MQQHYRISTVSPPPSPAPAPMGNRVVDWGRKQRKPARLQRLSNHHFGTIDQTYTLPNLIFSGIFRLGYSAQVDNFSY